MKNKAQLLRHLSEVCAHVEQSRMADAFLILQDIQRDALNSAIDAITPENPQARSPNTEIRNECCAKIRELKQSI